MIPVYKPYLFEESKKYVIESIDSTWISSSGIFKNKVEDYFKEKFNVKHVLLTNNGTSATHLAASTAIQLKKLDNIIVPNNVYVAAWNSLLFDNINLNIIPIDADLSTWNFNELEVVNLANTLEGNTGILVVHNLGNIINVPKLQKLLPDCTFIEDNCEGLFGKYNNDFSGTACFSSSCSFYGNKTVTCGEGGVFITNDDYAFELADSLHGQGQSKKKRYVHDRLAYNYRMTNVTAAFLYGQLVNLDKILDEKDRVFSLYRNLLSEVPEISFQKISNSTKHSNWIFGVRTKLNYHNKVQNELLSHGIETRPMFYPMSSHKHLKNIARKNKEKNASILSDECFMLPSYPELSDKNIEKIVSSLKNLVAKGNK